MALQLNRGGKSLPSRVLYYGVPGTGKTTFGAFAPSPVFLLTPGETGLLTLMAYNRAPEVDWQAPKTWGECMTFLSDVLKDTGDHKTLVVDVANGVESMCHEHVAATKFNGSMQSYLDFDKGPAGAVPEWRRFFAALDLIREKRGMMVVLLAHAAAKRVKMPEGDDYDKNSPLIHDKFRAPLMQWADIIVYARRVVGTARKGMTTKATTLGDLQLVCCEGPTHEAKNRIGLPPVIDIPDEEPASLFGAFASAMKVAKRASQVKRPEPEEEIPAADAAVTAA